MWAWQLHRWMLVSNNFHQDVFIFTIVLWMQWDETWGWAAVKAGVGQHVGCFLFDWTCHAFTQSAVGEHLGLAGWCSAMTWVVCAGPLWHVGWVRDDKEASVWLGEQQTPLMFLQGLERNRFWRLILQLLTVSNDIWIKFKAVVELNRCQTSTCRKDYKGFVGEDCLFKLIEINIPLFPLFHL